VTVYVVILAGGGGTRLWPLSRARRPKPFLPLLDGGRSLLAATVDRLAPLVALADVYVVTDARYAPLVHEAVPSIAPDHVVGEPQGRNTAAAVALAAHVIERPADEVMISLHADQAIVDEAGFRAALEAAASRAADGDIVTLGITPDGPATGYGYILAAGAASTYAGRDTFRVERFEEKPSPARAQELIDGGRAYWNAGSFVWRRDTLLAGLAEHASDVAGPIADWFGGPGAVRQDGVEAWPADAIADVYAGLPARAIDHALLEPASMQGRVAVVPAAVGWSDLGSWAALRRHRATGDGSVVTVEAGARVVEVGSSHTLVHAGSGRTIAVVGLDDIVIIDTPDALLVSRTGASEDVKTVVDRLRESGADELL
jgi:mannose-1-phosphate guanylyltransferase